MCIISHNTQNPVHVIAGVYYLACARFCMGQALCYLAHTRAMRVFAHTHLRDNTYTSVRDKSSTRKLCAMTHRRARNMRVTTHTRTRECAKS